jgi:hypothetical protein
MQLWDRNVAERVAKIKGAAGRERGWHAPKATGRALHA